MHSGYESGYWHNGKLGTDRALIRYPGDRWCGLRCRGLFNCLRTSRSCRIRRRSHGTYTELARGWWNIHRLSRASSLCAALTVLTALAVLQPPAAAVAGLPALAASASAGSIGIQLLEAPTNRESDPRAHMYVIDYLAPGTVIHRKFEVTNTSGSAQHVDLYAAGAAIAGDAFAVAPDRTPDELSGWVSLDQSARELPAGGSAVVEAAITVPKSAVSGERYAVIWAQDSSLSTAAGDIRMVNRVGLRLYLDVGEVSAARDCA